jgi:hypothetical protein
MLVQRLTLAAVAVLLAGCGAQEPTASSPGPKRQPTWPHARGVDGAHYRYRARLFTPELRGAADIPLHVDGPDGSRVDLRADTDGRFCLIVPAVNTEAGSAEPRITVDWSGIDQARPSEETRFAHDAIRGRLAASPGFIVTPDTITGTERDRPVSIGIPQSEDWRGGQDDAARCHVVERGRDTVVANAEMDGAGPVTAERHAPGAEAQLTAARALARAAADELDACYRRRRAYLGCDRGLHTQQRRVGGGLVMGPSVLLNRYGYQVSFGGPAGTYSVSSGVPAQKRTERCQDARVVTCPPGLAP